jgi:hypothetical protein
VIQKQPRRSAGSRRALSEKKAGSLSCAPRFGYQARPVIIKYLQTHYTPDTRNP